MTKKLFLPLLLSLILTLCACAAQQAPQAAAVPEESSRTPKSAAEEAPQAPAYPTIAPVSAIRKENLQLSEADCALCTFSHPGENWEFSVSGERPTLTHFNKGIADGMSISLTFNGKRRILQNGVIDQTIADGLLDSYASYAPGVTFSSEQLCTFMDEPLFRFDATLPFDEAYIDDMLEKGELTEESLELAGGREALLALPAVEQCVFCTVSGDDIVTITGVYAEKSQKIALMEAMRIVLETLQVK